MSTSLEKIKEKVLPFIQKAGNEAFATWKNIEVEYHKDHVNVTTSMDKKIEKEFSDFVIKNFPDHGFYGEEHPELFKPGEYMWYIDPIDGSKYYAKQVPLWSVSIALYHRDQPLFATIYNPISHQLYWSITGKGTFLNNEKIQMNEVMNLAHAKVAIEFNMGADEYLERKDYINKMWENVFGSVYRVRMLGSASLSLSWLSQGYFDAFIFPYCTKDKIEDIAAGRLLAQEAGAYIFHTPRKDLPDIEIYIIGKKSLVDQLIPMVVF